MNFLAGDRNKLDLDELRRVLIRLEDTIIFAMIERAQFPHNSIIYDKTAPEFASLQLEGAHPKRSFLEYLLFEIEQVHARVRRYTSPDERPFSDPASLPRPILPSLNYRMKVVDGPSINLNHILLQTYIDKIVPKICAKSGNDDQNYGSAATRDVECLQALSRRIHYGIFIAEAKFLEDTTTYTRLIRARDDKGILKLLTNEAVFFLFIVATRLFTFVGGRKAAQSIATKSRAVRPGRSRRHEHGQFQNFS